MRIFAFVLAACFAVDPFTVSGFTAFTPRGNAAKSSPLSMTAVESDNVKNVKVGVIGCGRIGLVHLEAITKAPNVTPVIVSNPTVSKAEAGKNKAGFE